MATITMELGPNDYLYSTVEKLIEAPQPLPRTLSMLFTSEGFFRYNRMIKLLGYGLIEERDGKYGLINYCRKDDKIILSSSIDSIL